MGTMRTSKKLANWCGTVRRLMVAALLVLTIIPVIAAPAAASSFRDFFSYDYSVQFSQSQVATGEIFNAIVQAQATCANDLPLTPTEAAVITRIVATHQTSGARVTLNAGYTVMISPFPGSPGQSMETARTVPLQFPSGSQPGSYDVAGEIYDAMVKVQMSWMAVKDYFPPSQDLGVIDYSSGSTGGATSPPPPAPAVPKPSAAEPTPPPAPVPEPSIAETPPPSAPLPKPMAVAKPQLAPPPTPPLPIPEAEPVPAPVSIPMTVPALLLAVILGDWRIAGGIAAGMLVILVLVVWIVRRSSWDWE